MKPAVFLYFTVFLLFATLGRAFQSCPVIVVHIEFISLEREWLTEIRISTWFRGTATIIVLSLNALHRLSVFIWKVRAGLGYQRQGTAGCQSGERAHVHDSDYVDRLMESTLPPRPNQTSMIRRNEEKASTTCFAICNPNIHHHPDSQNLP